MKSFIIGLSILFIFTVSTMLQQQINLHQYHIIKARNVAEEMAASASQFIVYEEYSKGYIVFNREEGIKAAEEILRTNLNLDNRFIPNKPGFLKDRVTYQLLFMDDYNTTYPYMYNYNETFSIRINHPSVICVLDVGKPYYNFNFVSSTNIVRIAAFEWKDY